VVETVAGVLDDAVHRLRASGSETARLDAEVLLSNILGIDRTALIAHPEQIVGTGDRDRYAADVERRARGEPVAYIRGLKEFFGLAFSVDERALIPRPETERLVELGVAEVMARLTAAAGSRDPVRIVDVGTGSGIVAISLAVELRRRRVDLGSDVEIVATDASPAALSLARENAVGHAVADVIPFVEADLLPTDDGRRFDVVLANLPYVRSGAMAALPIATSFEPSAALDGGEDGLAVIDRLLAELPGRLADDGAALLEIGGDQGDDAVALGMERLASWRVELEEDLGGLPRVLRVSRSPEP
jgi:release factor glutamine methyltransferase